MARVSKFGKKAQESSLGKLVDQVIADSPNSIRDLGYATDFIESPTGLNLKLFPAQRVVVKLTFGVPLDYKPMMVPVYDPLKEKLLYTFTEDEFVKYLFDQGRCNVHDWRDIPPHGFGTTVLVAGRRGGKSEVVAAIAGTCLRNLLAIRNPHDYYGLAEGSPIDFTFLGTDEDSSTRLYDKLSARVNASPFYTPYIAEPGTTAMTFVSQADRERRDIKPSITAAAFPCTTRSVRGPSSYFLALDEFAHFKPNKDTTSDAMYEAATPSTGFFVSKEDPERADSRILAISSPLNKLGKFYDLHKEALAGGIGSNILTLRLSTAEMNPKFPASKLREAFKDNPESFNMEYAANFADGAGSYMPPEKFEICIKADRHNLTRFDIGTVGRRFFWALDYGTKVDATALAIAHLEMRERGVTLVYDYIDRMMVGEPFTGPGVDPERAAAVEHLKELNLVDVVSWLYYMHQILPCFKGVTDQHGGTTLKQLLQIQGITAMDLLHLTDQINSRMYLVLKGFVNNGCAEFPDVDKFKTEFKQLEAEYKSKYVLKVEAPNEKGAHDDMADAAALCAYIAQKWLDEEGKLDRDPTGRILQVDPLILNPNAFVDPNSVSIRELQVRERMMRLGIGMNLPPTYTHVRSPYGKRR